MQLNDWLSLHSNVANAITWEDARGRISSYPGWSPARKAALESEYKAYLGGAPTPLDDPPANLLQVNEYDFAFTRIDAAHAWKLYLSHIACGLWCEIGRHVSWSVTAYPDKALHTLFDSREMFRWWGSPTPNELGYIGANLPGYEIDIVTCGTVVPAPPAAVLHFLHTASILPQLRLGPPNPPHGLLGDGKAARFDVICKMLDWCRNLIHFGGNEGPLVMEEFWQYPGFSPVMRVLNGTVKSMDSSGILKHYTAGCSGTAGLLRAVLRVINIPAEIRRPAEHAQPWFPLENVGLCHGDDPYMRRLRFFPTQIQLGNAAFCYCSPPFPVTELFINASEYDKLFGTGAPADLKLANVDRRSTELALQYLPYYLLSDYCDDLATGSTKVWDRFKDLYTMDELKTGQLWQRLDDKLSSIGGCPVSDY